MSSTSHDYVSYTSADSPTGTGSYIFTFLPDGATQQGIRATRSASAAESSQSVGKDPVKAYIKWQRIARISLRAYA